VSCYRVWRGAPASPPAGSAASSPPSPRGGGDAARTENAVLYGQFIGNIIDFLVISFILFLIVRADQAGPRGGGRGDA